jgi:CO/xanthine dehydrogenase Mo-binding subunit
MNIIRNEYNKNELCNLGCKGGEIMPDEDRELIDRREEEDRRRAHDLEYFETAEAERRAFKERRDKTERRDGWLRIGNWVSMCAKALGFGKSYRAP